MTTTTKCMSKMNKKELYEFCKILVDENKRLQLFNNVQEECFKELETKNKELEEHLEYFQDKCEMLEKNNLELEDTLKLKEEEVGMLIYENRQ